jgi:hypothetical protein
MLNSYNMITYGYGTAMVLRLTPIYSAFVISYMLFLLYRKTTMLRRYIDIYYDSINNIYDMVVMWLYAAVFL